MSAPKPNEQGSRNVKPDKKKRHLLGFLSVIVILLLLGGLVFAIFSFVDQSHRGNERLKEKSIEEQKEKRDAEIKKEKARKEREAREKERSIEAAQAEQERSSS